MYTSTRRIQPHLQLVHRLPEIPGPVEQLGDGGEGAVLAEGPHAEDLGFGDLIYRGLPSRTAFKKGKARVIRTPSYSPPSTSKWGS